MAEYVCEITTESLPMGDINRYSHRERVVRCRNCENYIPAEDEDHDNGCALAYGGLFETNPNGFCAWAEERKGDS